MKIGTFVSDHTLPIAADERERMVEHFTNVAKSFFADLEFVESYELHKKYNLPKYDMGETFCIIFAFTDEKMLAEHRNIYKDRVSPLQFCVQVYKNQDKDGYIQYSASAWIVGKIKRYRCKKVEELHHGYRPYDYDTEISGLKYDGFVRQELRDLVLPIK